MTSGNRIIRLSPDHQRKINQLVEASPDRFRDADDFIFRAIDVFLSWEKNPVKVIDKLTDMEPTMLQFAFMQSMMEPDVLKQIYPGYPEKYGNEWKEFLNSIPDTGKTANEPEITQQTFESDNEFENIQNNLDSTRDFIKQINFNEISKEGYDDVKFDGATSNRDLLWDASADTLIARDNTKIAFGDTSTPDLSIYHDGSHSYVTNTTGDLKITDTSAMILATNSLRLKNGASDETYIAADNGSDVAIYFNNSKKIYYILLRIRNKH